MKTLVLFVLFFFSFVHGVIDPDDKAILQAFYDSLTSKGSITWNFDFDLCANPLSTGLTCDDDGKVIILNLISKSIYGTISTELGDLNRLQQLSLTGNNFNGTLPTELGKLHELNLLYMSTNKLSGTIPAEFGNLSRITSIYFVGNKLSGTIPVELINLQNLTSLYLADNQLSGTIPSELGLLKKLESINLSSNQLYGTIPIELKNLTIPMYLEKNYFDCPVLNYAYLSSDYPNLQKQCNDSCPPNRCQSGFICSMRDSPGWNCSDINECLTNKGGCHLLANCVNTEGSRNCICPLGFLGNGVDDCYCPENMFLRNSSCQSCPLNSVSQENVTSIIDCKCINENHFVNTSSQTCEPCPYGSLVDLTLNICQKVRCPEMKTNPSDFPSTEYGNVVTPSCNTGYVIFEKEEPRQDNNYAIAMCELVNASYAEWNITQPCEESCAKHPCENNQQCVYPSGAMNAKCICAGYYGRYCQNVDPQGCNTLRCSNGGLCMNKTETNAAYCNCDDTGFEGIFCETDVNDCMTNVTCLNGGTCYDVGKELTVCLCLEGFTGKDCNSCTPNTCKNKGDCSIVNGTITCNCFGTGYEGAKCEVSKNDCRTVPCERGRCLIYNDVATCDCNATNYEGDRCEMSINPCNSDPCQGRGDCLHTGPNEYECRCSGKWTGIQNCENYSSVSDQNSIFYILGILFGFFFLILLVLLVINTRHEFVGIGQFIFKLFFVTMSIFDVISDIFFVLETNDWGYENNDFLYFYTSLAFLVIPVTLSTLGTIILLIWKGNDLQLYSVRERLTFAIVTLFSADAWDALEFVIIIEGLAQQYKSKTPNENKKIYLRQREKGEMLTKTFKIYLVPLWVVKMIEDVPQFIIQIFFQSSTPANTIVILSLTSSIFTISLSLLLFLVAKYLSPSTTTENKMTQLSDFDSSLESKLKE